MRGRRRRDGCSPGNQTEIVIQQKRGILIGNQKQLLENFRNKTVKNIDLLHVYSEQVCEIFAVFVELI
jgi:hypothetical protein